MNNIKDIIYSRATQAAHNESTDSATSVASVSQHMDPTDSLLIAMFNIRFEIGKQTRS